MKPAILKGLKDSQVVALCGAMKLSPLGTGQRRFEILAYAGGKLNIDGLPVPVVIELESLQQRPGFSVLVDHKATAASTLGQTDRMDNDGRRVIIAGNVTGDHWPAVANVLKQSDKGHEWEASVGAFYDLAEADFVEGGTTRAVNGQILPGPFILAKNAVLRHTAILPQGADPNTKVNLAAMAALTLKGNLTMKTFEQFCASLGLNPATMSDSEKAAAKMSYDMLYGGATDAETVEASVETKTEEPKQGEVEAAAAVNLQAAGSTTAAGSAVVPPAQLTPPNLGTTQPATANIQAGGVPVARPVDPGLLMQNMRNAAADDFVRVQQIQARCAGQPQIIAAAIRGGWTPDQAELQMRRAVERSSAPAGHSRSHEGSCTLQALQGAIMLRAGLRLDHPAWNGDYARHMSIPGFLRAGLNESERNRWMDEAHRYAGLSMIDICREAIRLDRRECPIDQRGIIEAAFSGGSLSNIFTTNMNAQLLAAFDEAPDTTLGWVEETENANFQEVERFGMKKGAGLKRLPRGKEADHIQRSDKGERLKISRYAGQFIVDDQDIIDDSFGALNDNTPEEMGQAAKRLRPDLVYSILLENPTLVTTGRALFNTTENNLTGSAAFANDKLSEAIARLMVQQENGVTLNLPPTHLVVPPKIRDTVRQAIDSPVVVVSGGTDVKIGANNPLVDYTLKLVSDGRLQIGINDPRTETLRSGSESTWFLVSAQSKKPIVVAYRRGTGRAPMVRKFDLSQGRWGMGWDINMDVGAAAENPQCIQKMQSAAL